MEHTHWNTHAGKGSETLGSSGVRSDQRDDTAFARPKRCHVGGLDRVAYLFSATALAPSAALEATCSGASHSGVPSRMPVRQQRGAAGKGSVYVKKRQRFGEEGHCLKRRPAVFTHSVTRQCLLYRLMALPLLSGSPAANEADRIDRTCTTKETACRSIRHRLIISSVGTESTAPSDRPPPTQHE